VEVLGSGFAWVDFLLVQNRIDEVEVGLNRWTNSGKRDLLGRARIDPPGPNDDANLYWSRLSEPSLDTPR